MSYCLLPGYKIEDIMKYRSFLWINLFNKNAEIQVSQLTENQVGFTGIFI